MKKILSIFYLEHSECANIGLVGDRYCDDITNTLECNFDGGDCCGVDANTQYCSECQCKEGNTTSMPSTTKRGKIINQKQ